LPGAKFYLPGFRITLRKEHHYTTVEGARHMEPVGAYQAHIHWHEGADRLALDPVSQRTADASSIRYVSHPFICLPWATGYLTS